MSNQFMDYDVFHGYDDIIRTKALFSKVFMIKFYMGLDQADSDACSKPM